MNPALPFPRQIVAADEVALQVDAVQAALLQIPEDVTDDAIAVHPVDDAVPHADAKDLRVGRFQVLPKSGG